MEVNPNPAVGRSVTATEFNVVTILDAMEEAARGAKAQYIGDVFTLDLPTFEHQRTLTKLIGAMTVPEGLTPIFKVLVSNGEAWIVPDLIVIPESLAKSDSVDPLAPTDLSLMVEILSPASEPFDRGPKRAVAERHGIDYWIVHPGERWKQIEHLPYGGGLLTAPH